VFSTRGTYIETVSNIIYVAVKLNFFMECPKGSRERERERDSQVEFDPLKR